MEIERLGFEGLFQKRRGLCGRTTGLLEGIFTLDEQLEVVLDTKLISYKQQLLKRLIYQPLQSKKALIESPNVVRVLQDYF